MIELSFLRLALPWLVLAATRSIPSLEAPPPARVGMGSFERLSADVQGWRLAPGVRPELTAEGLRLSAASDAPSAWEWSLRFAAVGRGDEVVCVSEPTVHIDAGRVEFRRGEIVEWYVDHPRGIEHGFTIAAPPVAAGMGALRLELEIGGTLRPSLLSSERGARFATEDGRAVLLYDGLAVWDAERRSLPARFTLEGSVLGIEIEVTGAAWPVVVDPVIYTEDAVILPAQPTENFAFGVAAAGDGETFVVGDHYAHGAAPASGAVYVYVRAGSDWVRQAQLVASDGEGGDWFGFAVAITDNTVVVGAREDDDHGTSSGSVYVFERNGTTWIQTQKLTASDAGPGDGFGESLSIEGTTLLVGAPGDDPMGTASGSAYVFCHDGSSWVQQHKIVPSDGSSQDWFGWSVLLHGTYAFCSAIQSDEGGVEVGSVYVYEGACGSWAQTAKLVPGDGVQSGFFGYSLLADGSRLAVGSTYATGVSWFTGAVYLYQRAGTSWNLETKLFASDGGDQHQLGEGMVWEDDLLIVSAPTGDALDAGAGACYVFRHSPTGWNEEAKLVASDGHTSGALGSSVVLLDGTLLAGAHSQGPSAHGAVYVYELPYQFESYCFGDGSASPCPCGNESPPGGQAGCTNSTGQGARLLASGTSSLSADDLIFDAEQLVPGQPVLLFAGENAVNGGAGIPFGDGLRCAGTNVVRISIQTADPAGNASFGPGLALPSGWRPGDRNYFQVWYRDPIGSPCGASFNTTNGIEVGWVQ